MDVSLIINRVKAKLDELTPFNEGLVVTGSSFTDLTYKYINEVLDESLYDLTMGASILALPLFDLTLSEGMTNSDNVLIVKLPLDCIRVASVKLPTWKRDVTKFITPESNNYALQFNRWTRGNSDKPVVALTGSAPDKYIECYTTDMLTATSNTKIGKYIKKLTSATLTDLLFDPLTWLMTSKVLLIFEKEKLSELAFKEFQKSLMLR